MDYYHCIGFDIHLNTWAQKTVITEIRTQMHSLTSRITCRRVVLLCEHGTKSVYFPFASVITQLKCIEIISNVRWFLFRFQRKVHSIRTLSQCKSYYTFFYFSKHTLYTTYHMQCAFLFVYTRALHVKIKRRTTQIHKHTNINKCIVNLFTHN